jgi:hypothetical protein
MFASAAVLLIGVAASAAPYGTAGCGLGSIVFGNQKGIIQIFAATTNGIAGTQTFGITTGTSNCAETAGSAGARLFIETNREALAKNISRGQGETLRNLSAMAGCNDTAALGAKLQKNFDVIFPNASVPNEQVADSVIKELKGMSCERIIKA